MKTLSLIIFLYYCYYPNLEVHKNMTYEVNSSYTINKNKLVSLSVPISGYGSAVNVYSVLGENSGCKISLFENNTSGIVIIQYRTNNNKTWRTLRNGQYIKGQSVWCRVKGLGGSGAVTLKIIN